MKTSVYDDPAVKKALPFSETLKQSVEQAKARPVSPVYPQISQAIYKNVNSALSGQTSPEDAIKQAQADIDEGAEHLLAMEAASIQGAPARAALPGPLGEEARVLHGVAVDGC